jgi:hypothetical protein
LALSLQESKAAFNFDINIFSLKGKQFHIEIRDPENDKAKPMIFTGTKLRLEAPIDRSNPQGSIQDIIKPFQKILDNGSTPLRVSLKGFLSIIGGSVDDLTDAEVQVLADYPLRAARLLRIIKYAKKSCTTCCTAQFTRRSLSTYLVRLCVRQGIW